MFIESNQQELEAWKSKHLIGGATVEPGNVEFYSDKTGYQKFVGDIKKAMTTEFVDDSLISKIENSGGNFEENIASWLELVQEDEDKLKKITGEITFVDGSRKLRLKPEIDVRRASNLEEKCNDYKLLYTLALAQAKLELVKEVATDVYPALESQFDAYVSYLEEIKNGVLKQPEVKNEAKSLDSLTTTSLSKKMLIPVLATAVMASIILSGCATSAEAATTKAPTTTATAQATEKAPVTPSFTATIFVTEKAPNDALPSAEVQKIIDNIGPLFSMDQLDKPENIPFEDWEKLNSSDFAEALVYMANHNLLPKPPKTAIPYENVIYHNDLTKLGSGGFDSAILPDQRWKYRKPESRPYVPVLIRKTSFPEGFSPYVLYLSFLNKDGSYGVVGIVYPIKEKIIKENKTGIVGAQEYAILTGSVFKDETVCRKMNGDPVEASVTDVFCKWVIKEQNNPGTVDVLNKWAQSDVLDNRLGTKGKYRIPMLVPGAKATQ